MQDKHQHGSACEARAQALADQVEFIGGRVVKIGDVMFPATDLQGYYDGWDADMNIRFSPLHLSFKVMDESGGFEAGIFAAQEGMLCSQTNPCQPIFVVDIDHQWGHLLNDWDEFIQGYINNNKESK